MGISFEAWVLLMASALKDNGSTGKWRKIRARILQRDGYTCQACGMDGNHVDHIIPRNLFGEGNAVLMPVTYFPRLTLADDLQPHIETLTYPHKHK